MRLLLIRFENIGLTVITTHLTQSLLYQLWVVLTSGRLHSEIVRLLFLQDHRETEASHSHMSHLQTEHVMCTQVYMTPEYHRGGELSTKVDAFAFGLVIIETLTGYAVCSPAPGHRDLLSMFEENLDNPTKLLAHLDKPAS